MAKIYANLVRNGNMQLKDVPKMWREETKRFLNE